MGRIITLSAAVLLLPVILFLSPQAKAQDVSTAAVARPDFQRTGFATVGLSAAARRKLTAQPGASQPRANVPLPPHAYVPLKGEGHAYVPLPLQTNIGKTPSSLNLSGDDNVRVPQPAPGAYSPQLETRSLRMFPLGSQEQERQQWMADQEQQAIANEINRTKPLQYPVIGR